MLQGHPIGNRAIGRVGALNQPPRPFYNRISLHQPTEPSSLKQLLGRLLVGGEGGSFKPPQISSLLALILLVGQSHLRCLETSAYPAGGLGV